MSVAMPAVDISRALTRIAHEILERNGGAQSITLLGIPHARGPFGKKAGPINRDY